MDEEVAGAEHSFTALSFLGVPTDFLALQDNNVSAENSTSKCKTTKARFAHKREQASRRMSLMESVAMSLEAENVRAREEKFEKSVRAAKEVVKSAFPNSSSIQRRVSNLSMSFSARHGGRQSLSSMDSLDQSMQTLSNTEVRPNQTEPHVASGNAVTAVGAVVQRAAAHLMEKVIMSRAEQMMKKQKEEEAADRRKFLENIRRNQRVCMWLSIVKSLRFSLKARTSVGQLRKKEAIQATFRPMFVLLMRRLCRKIKLRSLIPVAVKPTLAQIRFDKLLALFSDSHLLHFIAHMEPKYYFPNEAIVFKDCQDDEAFFLQIGTADVMSGHTKVFTLKSGMTFGSMGMISGEPRSATIIAREQCLVWVGSRSVFESYGVNDHMAETGHVFITELRQKNMRQVYESTLHPDYLVKFPLLRSLSAESLGFLTAEGDARAFKPQEVLVGIFRPPPMNQRGILVLRGRMKIVVRRDRLPLDGNLEAAFAEDAAWIVDLPRKTDRINFFAAPEQLEEPRELKGMFAVADFVGPCLLAIPSVVVSEWKVMGVVGESATDVLLIHRDRFFGLDLVALADLRQNSINIHCRFMKQPTSDELQKIMFSTNISFDFLRSLRLSKLQLTPWVFSAGDVLHFDEAHDHEVFIIMGGSINDRLVSSPMIWPEITTAYFGCMNAGVVCTSRVEAFRFKRSSIISLFDALSAERMEVLGLALAELFASKYNRRPIFCESTLVGVISKRSRYMLKRIQSAKVPQKQQQSSSETGSPVSPGGRRKSVKQLVSFDDVPEVAEVVTSPPKVNARQPHAQASFSSVHRPSTAGTCNTTVTTGTRPKSSGSSFRAPQRSPPSAPLKPDDGYSPKPPVPRFPHVERAEATKTATDTRPSTGRRQVQVPPAAIKSAVPNRHPIPPQPSARCQYPAVVHHLNIRRSVAERKVHNELKKVTGVVQDPIELLGTLPQFYVNRIRRLDEFMSRDK